MSVKARVSHRSTGTKLPTAPGCAQPAHTAQLGSQGRQGVQWALGESRLFSHFSGCQTAQSACNLGRERSPGEQEGKEWRRLLPMLSAGQPTEKQGKTDKKLAKIQSMMPKDPRKGRNAAAKQCSRNKRDAQPWFLHAVPSRSDSLMSESTAGLSCSFGNWGGMVGFSPAQHSWSTPDGFTGELISLLLLGKDKGVGHSPTPHRQKTSTEGSSSLLEGGCHAWPWCQAITSNTTCLTWGSPLLF